LTKSTEHLPRQRTQVRPALAHFVLLLAGLLCSGCFHAEQGYYRYDFSPLPPVRHTIAFEPVSLSEASEVRYEFSNPPNRALFIGLAFWAGLSDDQNALIQGTVVTASVEDHEGNELPIRPWWRPHTSDPKTRFSGELREPRIEGNWQGINVSDPPKGLNHPFEGGDAYIAGRVDLSGWSTYTLVLRIEPSDAARANPEHVPPAWPGFFGGGFF